MKIESAYLIGAVYTAAVGILAKLGWDIKGKVDNTYTKEEVRQLIDDKLDPLRVDMKNVKEDVGEIKTDVKELVKIHSNSKK